MLEWLGFAVVVVALGTLFFVLLRLLKRSQEGDPSKRGQDNSTPGGFYSDQAGH